MKCTNFHETNDFKKITTSAFGNHINKDSFDNVPHNDQQI